MAASGRHREALAQAFQAYREAPQDPRTHKVLIGVAITGRADPIPAEVVGPDVYVRLRNSSGETRERIVCSGEPIDRIRNETSVADAEVAGLLGKRVGDLVVKDAGQWTEEKWTVVEILPAVTFAVRDAMAHFEERFSSEEFFLKRVRIGDGGSVKDFSPLIAGLEGRRQQAETVFRLYREQMMPLGFVARVLGASIPEIMRGIVADPASGKMVPTEWSNSEGQAASRTAAAGGREVVLTRSALQTIWDLKLMEVVAAAYKLVAPRSLLKELRAEAKEASDHVAHGRGTLVGADTGFRMLQVEPGSTILQAVLDELHAQIKWLENNARAAARPLASIQSGESDAEVREQLGQSSADALDLVRHEAATLYADDLGLRRMIAPNLSFSTIGLVRGLVDRHGIDEQKRDELLLELVERGHGFVIPTVALLSCAIRHYGRLKSSKLRAAFALLGALALSPSDAAQIGAQVIRTNTTATIQTVTNEEIAQLILEGMTTKWSAPLAALQLRLAVADCLVLLPQVVQTVDGTAIKFVRQHSN